MSHELRTPLNSLLVLAQLLAGNFDGNLTPRQVQYAETIHSAGSDLLMLISDILDLTTIEAGRMVVQPETIVIRTLLDDLRATFGPLALEKNLELTIEADKDVPEELVTDEQRLRQILRNILSNAVKFTHVGSVKLRASIEDAVGSDAAAAGEVGEPSETGRVIAFTAADTGIGIAEDKLQVVFGAFQQADGTINPRYGGTGLGLSISTELAHLLGGRITVRSTLGRGSEFALRVPLERVPERRTAPETVPDPAAGRDTDQGAEQGGRFDGRFSGEKVLIVDDDVRNTFALVSVLEARGLTVHHAENGREGIDLLQQIGDVDLVVMDIMMPIMDGYTAMRKIRQMDRFVEMPVISLSARAMPGDREKALEAGATEYVTKPVDPDYFVSLVKYFLEPRRHLQRSRETR
jgi:CheY-like chemotaxis protein